MTSEAQDDAAMAEACQREASTHATPGDLCTDDCRHLCPACELGYGEVCEDLFEHPIAGVIACMSDQAVAS